MYDLTQKSSVKNYKVKQRVKSGSKKIPATMTHTINLPKLTKKQL
jgi:hypothetical protein